MDHLGSGKFLAQLYEVQWLIVLSFKRSSLALEINAPTDVCRESSQLSQCHSFKLSASVDIFKAIFTNRWS